MLEVGHIMANQITLLSGYQAHARLTKRTLALKGTIRDIDVSTIDAYQGEENRLDSKKAGIDQPGSMAHTASQTE